MSAATASTTAQQLSRDLRLLVSLGVDEVLWRGRVQDLLDRRLSEREAAWMVSTLAQHRAEPFSDQWSDAVDRLARQLVAKSWADS